MGKTSRIESLNALKLPAYVEQLLANITLNYVAKESAANYSITLESADTLSKESLEACFDIIATTSKADYVASAGGWHPKAKKKEMKLPDLRYLLVHADSQPQPLGFASFMLTYEDGYEVIYLYEIHLSDALRGLGLGKHLLGIVEKVGRNAGVDKIMLTVFVHNTTAMEWYDRLGFETDEYSPGPRKLRSGVVKEPDYRILSKPLTRPAGSKK